MKTIKSTDPKLQEKMNDCAKNNESFKVVEAGKTLHIFTAKKENEPNFVSNSLSEKGLFAWPKEQY